MSDSGKINKSKDDVRENDSVTSEYHNLKTPSPPIPIRSTVATPTSDGQNTPISTTSSVSSRLGHLEDQKKLHSQSRQSQAAKNSVTSIASKKSTTSKVSAVAKTDKMISNSPDGGGGGGDSDDDYFEDDEHVEKVLDAELVSDDVKSARNMERLVRTAFFDLFIILPLMLIPSVALYFCLDEPFYNIMYTKNPEDMNLTMECIRYNLFSVFAYGLYVISDVLSLVIPEGILLFSTVVKTKDGTKSVSTIVRSQMNLLIDVRKNVALSLWFIALVPLAGTFLYKSMFLTPWDLLHKIMSIDLEKLVEGTTKIDQEKMIADETRSLMQRYAEIIFVLLAIFSSVLAVEKYCMQIFLLNFHSKAFAKRISDCNQKFGYLIRLYEAVKFGKPRVLSNNSLISNLDSSTDLKTDKGIHLTSLHRAKSIAKLIYRSLLPADADGRDYLLVEDFKKWTNYPDETFASFDLDQTGKLSEEEIEDAVVEIYNSRTNLLRGLKSNARVVKKLDNLFVITAVLIGGVIASPVFDMGAVSLFATMSVFSASFGFLFHSTAKSCFESILFVFIQHPFDVGDRVIIDGETFVIEDIEVFTTKMIRWDGILVYITNFSLCSKVIQNIRRSENQIESLDLKIKGDTPAESILNLTVELKKQLESHKRNFTGQIDLAHLDKLPANNEPMSLSVQAQVRGNFQNPAKMNSRKTELFDIVDKALLNCNISKA